MQVSSSLRVGEGKGWVRVRGGGRYKLEGNCVKEIENYNRGWGAAYSQI